MNPNKKLCVAKRARGGPNSIRTMFGLASTLNAKRAQDGIPPLLSLGIGVPHMYVLAKNSFSVFSDIQTFLFDQ